MLTPIGGALGNLFIDMGITGETASNLQARNEIKKHDLDYIKSYSKILKELGFKNKLLI